MSIPKTNAIRLLDTLGITYELRAYDVDPAAEIVTRYNRYASLGRAHSQSALQIVEGQEQIIQSGAPLEENAQLLSLV
jgi:hypothetical protein